MFFNRISKLLKRWTTPPSGGILPSVKSATTNGVWTWFTEPNVYVAYGYTWIGSCSNSGQIKVTRVSTDGTASTFVVATLGEIDDHNNPSFLALPDNKLLVAYSEHISSTSSTRFKVCNNVTDFTNGANWTSEVVIPNSSGHASSYANPFLFSDNVLRMIKRERNTSNNNWRISLISCPLANILTPANWTITPIFTGLDGTGRPYIRWALNESNPDRVDIFCTDGHPADTHSVQASLYHCSIQLVGGAIKYYKSNGTEITASLPFPVMSNMTVIENDAVDHWVWDVKAKDANNIRALGQRNKNNNGTYAEYILYTWNGSTWTKQVLFDPAFTSPLYSAEPMYTGGICFHQGNWNKVFSTARNASGGIYLAQYLIDPTQGTIKKIADITFNSNSTMFNCRPQSPIGWTYGHPEVTWWRGRYTTWTDFNTDVMTYK